MDVSAIHSSPQLQAKAQIPADQIAERRELIRASKTINASQVLGGDNELVFVMDRTSHRAIMRVVDRKTQEVVMQLPPEYVLRLAEDLNQKG
jgi:uncharacterized FlaG/YvyC family protein